MHMCFASSEASFLSFKTISVIWALMNEKRKWTILHAQLCISDGLSDVNFNFILKLIWESKKRQNDFFRKLTFPNLGEKSHSIYRSPGFAVKLAGNWKNLKNSKFENFHFLPFSSQKRTSKVAGYFENRWDCFMPQSGCVCVGIAIPSQMRVKGWQFFLY